MSDMSDLKKIRTGWDLSLLASGDEHEFELQRKEIEKSVNVFVEKWSADDQYLKNAEILKAALDDYEKLNRVYGTSGNEGYYFHLSLSLEQDNADIIGGSFPCWVCDPFAGDVIGCIEKGES